MRSILVFSVVTLALFVAYGASPDNDHQQGIEQLCSDFVEAIARDNSVAYCHCWIPAWRLRDLSKKHTPSRDSAKVYEYAYARDRVVATMFQPLRNELEKVSKDLSGMRLITADATVEKKRDMLSTSRINLTIQVTKNTTVRYTVDDGVYLDGRWYFVDKPGNAIGINRDGRETAVMLTRE